MASKRILRKYDLESVEELSSMTLWEIINELNKHKVEEIKLWFRHLLEEMELAFNNNENIFQKLNRFVSQCVYYAIRSRNTELLEPFLDKQPGNYFTKRQEELDELLSSKYKELKIVRNVGLSDEMEIFLTEALLYLRISTETEGVSKDNCTHEDIHTRIRFITKNIEVLRTESASTDNEETILFVSRNIAQNIFILKRLLKSTYLRIPWEEMEFCIVSYICYMQDHQRNIFNCILTKTALLKYLEVFADCLNKETENINNIPIKKLGRLAFVKRVTVEENIIKNYPVFEELYQDYKLMRDTYSLQVIYKHVELVGSVDPTIESDQYVIIRALQVIGENLKSTLESPKLSTDTSDLILFLFPYNSSQIIKNLRNSLSHGMSLFKYQEKREKERTQFFSSIQNDIKKIIPKLINILYKNTFKIIERLMEKIISSGNFKEVVKLCEICKTFQLKEETKLQFNVRAEVEEVETLVLELERVITDKNTELESILKRIKEIIYDEKFTIVSWQEIYHEILLMLPTEPILSNTAIIKCDAKRVLNFMDEKNLKYPYFREISDLTNDFFQIYKPTVFDKETLYQTWWIVHQIIWITEFESQNIKNIEKFKENISKEKNNDNVPENVEHNLISSNTFLNEKITTLKTILKEHNLNDTDCIAFTSYKKDSKFQAKVEVIIFAILSFLSDISETLADNLMHVDQTIPLLIGKNLRNHLAHDNTLNYAFLDPTLVIFLNAKIIVETNAVKLNTTIERELEKKSMSSQNVFNEYLDCIRCQLQLFGNLENGCLEETQHSIMKGADIRGRDCEMKTAMHFAAKSTNFKCFKFLLNHGLDVHDKDMRNQSILHVAATSGNTEIIEFLITQQKMAVDDTDNYGQSPLHLAAQNGSTEIVNLLLHHKANTNIYNRNGLTPFLYAVFYNHKDIVSLISVKQNNVDIKALQGFTSLHIAAQKGYLNIVEYLLENGADVNARSVKGATPFLNCVLYEHLQVAQTLILHGADVNAQTNDGWSPLHNAVERGNEELVEMLLNNGASVNTLDEVEDSDMKCEIPPPLGYAILSENMDIIEMLIKNGADTKTRMDIGYTYLHMAVTRSNTQIISFLLENKFHINIQDNLGFTPLHYNIMYGSSDITEFLIEKDAIVNVKSNDGSTPLHCAALIGNLEAALVLISKGADESATDNEGYTPLHFCTNTLQRPNYAFKYNIKEMSIRNYNMPKTLSEKKIEIASTLLKNGANIESKNKSNMTPLLFACLKQDNKFAECLIRNSASINVSGDIGGTPLHYAVEGNNLALIKTILKDCNKEFLNLKNIDGATALCTAVKYNYTTIASFLIQKGADVNIGEPLHEAVFRSFQEVTEILLQSNNIDAYKQFKERDTDMINLIAKHRNDHFLAYFLARMINDSRFSIFKTKLIEDESILDIACVHGHNEVVELLIRNGAKLNKSSLIAAVSFNNLELVKLLLNHKNIDINEQYQEKGFENSTLLHFAAQLGHLNIVKYLVNFGADMYLENSTGAKPIHAAAIEGHINIVEYFLDCKMPIDVRGFREKTLLHYGVQGGQYQLCDFLINSGVDVNSLDFYKSTPLHFASALGHIEIIKLLLDNGAYVNYVNILKYKPIDGSRDKDIQSLLGSTEKLFQAIRYNNTFYTMNCIKQGAVINAKNSEDMSALHYAAWLADKRIIEILLRNNSNPNIIGKDNSMPLHYASQFNSFETVRILLENGAIYNSVYQNKLPIELTVNKKVHYLLQQIDNCFEDVQNDSNEVFNKLKVLKNIKSIKAVKNAKNIRNKTIMDEAFCNNFSKIIELENHLEEDSHLNLISFSDNLFIRIFRTNLRYGTDALLMFTRIFFDYIMGNK